jgi:hypothetical protein
MRIVSRVVFLAALAMLGVWLWAVLYPSPEKVIRRQLNEIAKHVSSLGNEGTLARLATAQGLVGYFSTNAAVNIDTREEGRYDFVGRDEITQAILATPFADGSLSVKFLDVDVTVAPNKQSATARLTVDADVSGQRDEIVQEMKLTLQKISGRWLITHVETIRTLSILNFEPPRFPFIVLA